LGRRTIGVAMTAHPNWVYEIISRLDIIVQDGWRSSSTCDRDLFATDWLRIMPDQFKHDAERMRLIQRCLVLKSCCLGFTENSLLPTKMQKLKEFKYHERDKKGEPWDVISSRFTQSLRNKY